MDKKASLSTLVLKNLVRQALAEDIGSGDVTTEAVVPEDHELAVELVAREECILAGMPVF